MAAIIRRPYPHIIYLHHTLPLTPLLNTELVEGAIKYGCDALPRPSAYGRPVAQLTGFGDPLQAESAIENLHLISRDAMYLTARNHIHFPKPIEAED